MIKNGLNLNIKNKIQYLCFIFPENSLLFAQLIARTAKDIDVLIDSLPSEEATPELQVEL